MTYELVDDVDAMPTAKIVVYVITFGTKDHGDKYVLRRQVPGRNMLYIEKKPISVSDSLEEARAEVPDDLVCFQPTAGDDPVIVESWL
jgi:hypothetical protein